MHTHKEAIEDIIIPDVLNRASSVPLAMLVRQLMIVPFIFTPLKRVNKRVDSIYTSLVCLVKVALIFISKLFTVPAGTVLLNTVVVRVILG